MAHIGTGVEYGLHCLLYLVDERPAAPSSNDLAQLQGVSPTFLAKIFTKLEKGGIVTATDGIGGGYRLARPAHGISMLDVVDAVEGAKPLFDCREIRGLCAVFKGKAPGWSAKGVCEIHAVMLRAERSMRQELKRTSLADLAASVARKAVPGYTDDLHEWLKNRYDVRLQARRRSSATTGSHPRKRGAAAKEGRS